MESGIAEPGISLSDEQREFLKQCEEKFANRFTEQDEEFQKVKNLPDSAPPIVDPWYSRAPHNFNWSRNNNRGRRPYDRDRDRNRDKDWQNHRGGPGPVYANRYRVRGDRFY